MHRSLPLPFALSLLLAACSGGGGGGNGVSVPLNGPVTPFTSFSDITNNSLVEFASPEIDDGLGGFEMTAINVAATYDPALETVTSIDATTTDPVSALVYINNAGEAAQARLTIGFPVDDDLVTDFTSAPGLTGDADDFLAFANLTNGGATTADFLLFHAPDNDARALEYTSFGMWGLGLDTAEVNMGAATWGAQTPIMPLLGVATYEGQLLGTWVSNIDDTISYWEADSTLTADFGNATVGLGAINTRNLETGLPEVGLNIFNDGNATIAGNTFTGGSFGVVADGVATGEFNGAFYGPGATEAGAAFDITFNNGRYFGAVGGQSVP